MAYRQRHDGVAQNIHRDLSKKYVLETTDKRHDHMTGKVIETGDDKLLRDFSIQTDREIQARRPGMVFIDIFSEEKPMHDY